MVTCGISGRGRQSAAALAVDGRVVAAAEQAPLTRRVRRPARDERVPVEAIEACLAAAGVGVEDLSQVVFAEGYAATAQAPESGSVAFGHRRVASVSISRLAAFARIAEARGARTVLVADGPAAAIFSQGRQVRALPRANLLLTLTCRLATAFGLDHDNSAGAIAALEQLAAAAQPNGDDWFAELSTAGESVSKDEAAFDQALARAAADAGASLSDVATPLVRRARVVADVANAFLGVVASHFGELIASADDDVMVAGTVFRAPDFVFRVRRAAGRPCQVAPGVLFHSASIGAALACAVTAASVPDDLAIGPMTSEADAKAALENCRLDYVYEPRWPRLLERISRILERGKLVAWCQGRAEFGYPFQGTRSFLCDPSSRYARDNVNVFLLQRHLATPIPLALVEDASIDIETCGLSHQTINRISIPVAWRDRLRACVDAQGYAHAHLVPKGSGPLADLLQVHFQKTGVPGLANVPLCAADDVAAVSARDAVRTAFASSADALVIHRFLLMKDYWQLRDESA